jgi:hypothetical protein
MTNLSNISSIKYNYTDIVSDFNYNVPVRHGGRDDSIVSSLKLLLQQFVSQVSGVEYDKKSDLLILECKNIKYN